MAKKKRNKKTKEKDVLSNIDITKLTPRQQRLLVKAQSAREQRKRIEKKTIEQKLIDIRQKEKLRTLKKIKSSRLKQFGSSSQGLPSNGLLQRQETVKRIFATPSSAPPTRPNSLKQQVRVQRPLPNDVVSRDILSVESEALREAPRGAIFSENIFGDEDFRGREDFTSIS